MTVKIGLEEGCRLLFCFERCRIESLPVKTDSVERVEVLSCRLECDCSLEFILYYHPCPHIIHAIILLRLL
jgi:hypothetical protein